MAEFYTKRSVIEIVPIDIRGEHDKYLTGSDVEYARRFSAAKRRAAWHTWRGVVRKHIGASPIAYDATGAPVVEGGGVYLSVSHSADYVAVIISSERCAIDIESQMRNFEKVSSRFITPMEKALPESGEDLFLGAVWCAKETMYKYAAHREIDFLDDMHILETDFSRNYMRGALREHNSGSVLTLDLSVSLFDNSILTFIG